MADDEDLAGEVEPVPVLTRDDLRPAPPEPRAVWTYLVAVLAAGTLLAVAVVHADLSSVADDGWRSIARWASAAALVLLVLGLGAIVLAAGTDRRSAARTLSLASVIAVGAAVLVIGLADANGGQLATSSPIAVASPAEEPGRDVPLVPEDALDDAELAGSALPIEARTAVAIELTPAGRELFAAAMGCRPMDFVNNGLVGTAIGGTWTQPLLLVGSPFNESGREVARCARVVLRLPLEAGIVRPA